MSGGSWYLLARRFRLPTALLLSVSWCAALRLLVGPGVELPFGPVVAPVWLFAITGTALICVPVVSGGLVRAEQQAVRADRGLATARAASFVVVYALALAVFAGAEGRGGSPPLAVVALAAASLSLVAAALIGDAAVVVVLAAGLVVIFCSTQTWFAETLLQASTGETSASGLLLAAAVAIYAQRRGVRPRGWCRT